MFGIELKNYAVEGRLLGIRRLALPIRDQVVAALEEGQDIVLDFAGTNPTQSFVDELVGALVMDRGEGVLKRLTMRNCDEDTRTILHFVVSDRLNQLMQRQSLDFAY